MDTLRGNFADRADSVADEDAFDPAEEDSGRDGPPPEIGQDERRMQVRAYNHWASLLQDRNFPSIDDLEPDNLPDFGPCSVLLDFTEGIEDPGISYLGEKLAAECGADDEMRTLSDVPSRSLLSRITDHYMQILANQAPIGFEAEFVNERGVTILYRGILLPFSSDDDTIDFIYGVINWKEVADQQTTDELMLEIDQALAEEPEPAAPRHDNAPLTDWADGPASDGAMAAPEVDQVADLDLADTAWGEVPDDLPAPSFGDTEPPAEEFAEADEAEEYETEDTLDEPAAAAPQPPAPADGAPRFASLTDIAPRFAPAADEPFELELDHAYAFGSQPDDEELFEDLDEVGFESAYPDNAVQPAAQADFAHDEPYEIGEAPGTEIELAELDEDEMELGDWLASARELAMAARSSEDRTRNALYDAIGRAYDFSLAAAAAPEEFEELVADSGLTTQDRAPMTPVIKLVFGADYDKTRLTEYAAALSHAHRNGVARGMLADYLRGAEGGLKGVVAAERRARREHAGKPVEPVGAPREALARKLRKLAPVPFDAIDGAGREFALVMIRRAADGDVTLLGEIPDDVALVERAARKLLG